ncbi:hypothetical protein [Streptomyces sp. NPDC002156]
MGHYVRFYQLRCIETQDNGEDELWVDFRGQRVWGRGSINNGDTRPANNQVFAMVDSPADVVSLWDQDSADPDDHLGDFHIETRFSGLGEQVAEFRRFGSHHYTLTYEVRQQAW